MSAVMVGGKQPRTVKIPMPHDTIILSYREHFAIWLFPLYLFFYQHHSLSFQEGSLRSQGLGFLILGLS